jgi:hypothetical protein
MVWIRAADTDLDATAGSRARAACVHDPTSGRDDDGDGQQDGQHEREQPS